MNIPISWLKEYVNLDCDLKTFEDKMTMSGSKVEMTVQKCKEIEGVVVGKIVSIEKHPDADKLVVTKVDIGKSENIQIVTGATNVFVGAYVPIATDGSTIHGGVKIKKGKLRGELSQGMMCSIEELGYTRQDYPEAPENGIYIFEKEYDLGSDVVPILELAEDIVEFEITSNRPDCFSVIGIAREAAATFDKQLKYPDATVKEEAEGDIDSMISVEIENPELCPRYIARVVKNVKIEPSPQWLRHRLTSSGIRPINNIVDITNYVMLELGQPMHAFDIDNIDERKIIVRNAKEGETFTTLDGVERKLDPSMTVISDCNKAVAIAGVMGGENSKVTENATAILFESANFNGTNIRLTSKKLGLRTDSSSKYEKGIDPNLALEAVNRAVHLVEKLGYGEVVKGMVDCYPNKRDSWKVEYSPERINKFLGTNLSENDIINYLKRVEIVAENNVATIPTFRPDIEMEADILEEVARLYGYDNITPTLATGTPTVGKKSHKQIIEDIIKNTMISFGLCEALNYSFESPKVFDKLNIPKDSDLRNTVNIINPLGEDFSIMRTTTLNGILQSLSINYNRRNSQAWLFEMGKIYLPKSLPLNELPNEIEMLTIGMFGNADFYDLKGIIEGLLKTLGINNEEYIAEKELPFMHPGRCAKIFIDNQEIGFLGELYPAVTENYEIGEKVYVASINASILYEKASLEKLFKPLPKYPSVQRDIAMLIKEEIPVKSIENAIKEKGGKILVDVKLFDVYKGKQIQEGYKSVAYTLNFRAEDRTLKDDEVQAVINKILENLETKLCVQLRSK